MTEDQEHYYNLGKRAALTSRLWEIIRELGYEVDDMAKMVVQREDLIACLRRHCAEHGDNDWPDNLSPVDVIDKHLMRHLESNVRL